MTDKSKGTFYGEISNTRLAFYIARQGNCVVNTLVNQTNAMITLCSGNIINPADYQQKLENNTAQHSDSRCIRHRLHHKSSAARFLCQRFFQILVSRIYNS